MSDSPTSRTLAVLRERGITFQIVEHWNAFARRRIDLFDCIDIVACTPDGLVGIQVTSGDHHAARENKAKNSPRLKAWLDAGGKFEVWSWRKGGGRGKKKTWTLRITVVDNRQPCR